MIGTAAALALSTAGAGILGSVMAGKAQTASQLAASRIIGESTEKALETQWNMYQTGRADVAPYRASGLSALKELMYLTYGNDYGQAELDKAITEGAKTTSSTPWSGGKGQYGLSDEEAKLLNIFEGDFGTGEDVTGGEGGSKDEASWGAEELSKLTWEKLIPALREGKLTKKQATDMIDKWEQHWTTQMEEAGVDPQVISNSLRSQPTYRDAMAFINGSQFDDKGFYVKDQAGFWSLGMAERRDGGKSDTVGEQRIQASMGADKLNDIIWGKGGVLESYTAGRMTQKEFEGWVDKLWGEYADWVGRNIPDQKTREGTLTSQHDYLYKAGANSIPEKTKEIKVSTNGYVVGTPKATGAGGETPPAKNPYIDANGKFVLPEGFDVKKGWTGEWAPYVNEQVYGKDYFPGATDKTFNTWMTSKGWTGGTITTKEQFAALTPEQQGQYRTLLAERFKAGGGASSLTNTQDGMQRLTGATPPADGASNIWNPPVSTGKVKPEQVFTGENRLVYTANGPMTFKQALSSGYYNPETTDPADPVVQCWDPKVQRAYGETKMKLSEARAKGFIVNEAQANNTGWVPYEEYDKILQDTQLDTMGFRITSSTGLGSVNIAKNYLAANGMKQNPALTRSGAGYTPPSGEKPPPPPPDTPPPPPPPPAGETPPAKNPYIDANGKFVLPEGFDVKKGWTGEWSPYVNEQVYGKNYFPGATDEKFNTWMTSKGWTGGVITNKEQFFTLPEEQQGQYRTLLAERFAAGVTPAGGGGAGAGAGDENRPNFKESEMYQWQLKQGEKQMRRYLGAKGRTNSTYGFNTMRDFYQSLAAQEAEKNYSRVANLATMGQNAATQSGIWAQQAGSQMSNTVASGGRTQAGLVPNQASIWSGIGGAVGSGVETYSDLTNPKKPKKPPLGGYYDSSGNYIGE